jgi:hypothetical protein
MSTSSSQPAWSTSRSDSPDDVSIEKLLERPKSLAVPLAPAIAKTVYRAEGVPQGLDAREFQERLESAFRRDTPDVEFRVKINSFAKLHHDAKQSATFSITSRYAPPLLSSLTRRGHADLDIGKARVDGPEMICIDKAFEGLTVLFDTASEHDFISAE